MRVSEVGKGVHSHFQGTRAAVVAWQWESDLTHQSPPFVAVCCFCLSLAFGNGTLTFLWLLFPVGLVTSLWCRPGQLELTSPGHGQWLRNGQKPKPGQWDFAGALGTKALCSHWGYQARGMHACCCWGQPAPQHGTNLLRVRLTPEKTDEKEGLVSTPESSSARI